MNGEEVQGATTLGQSASNLWEWLRTWEDDSGGIHGPVVYHHRDNLRVLRPDTWTQGAALLGALRLHAASGEGRFLEAGGRLGTFLVSNYLPGLHAFRDSNFDQKPLGRPALEGNAIASLALLELAKAVGGGGEFFARAAKDNIENFVTRQWDPGVRAFAVVYHGGRAHIHNKGAMAVLAILAAEGNDPKGELTRTYAIPSAEYTLRAQVKSGPFEGAFPYADADTSYRTLYSLVVALGLLGLHAATADARYLASVQKLVDHLSRFVDQKTGFICHYHRAGYPQWVTDTVLYNLVRSRALKAAGDGGELKEADWAPKVLSSQYPSGGFPLSFGFDDLWYKQVMGARPEIRRWRDLLPLPAMNAWNLWFLSSFLEAGTAVPAPSVVFPHKVTSDREELEGPYSIVDTRTELNVSSAAAGTPVLSIVKGEDVPRVCTLFERTENWKTVDSIMRYPPLLRRLILAAPRYWMRLRR